MLLTEPEGVGNEGDTPASCSLSNIPSPIEMFDIVSSLCQTQAICVGDGMLLTAGLLCDGCSLLEECNESQISNFPLMDHSQQAAAEGIRM